MSGPSRSPGISAIICTHNGAARLGPTLEHLRRQHLTAAWEVVVVDNASTDDTAGVAAAAGIPGLRVIAEPEPGLTHARRAGVAAARYDVLVFVDDDNWLAPDFLATARDVLEREPRVGAAGGHLVPVPESEPPSWFAGVAHAYATGPQEDRPTPCLFGAGLVLRAAALDELAERGWTGVLTDRSGATLTAGGDVELCYAIALAGWEIRYVPDLRGEHFIPSHRLQWEHYLRMSRGFGAATVGFGGYIAAFRGARRLAPWPLALARTAFGSATATVRVRGAGHHPGDPRAADLEQRRGRLAALTRGRRTYRESVRQAARAAGKR